MKRKYEKPEVDILSLEIEESIMDDDEGDAEIGVSSSPNRPF